MSGELQTNFSDQFGAAINQAAVAAVGTAREIGSVISNAIALSAAAAGAQRPQDVQDIISGLQALAASASALNSPMLAALLGSLIVDAGKQSAKLAAEESTQEESKKAIDMADKKIHEFGKDEALGASLERLKIFEEKALKTLKGMDPKGEFTIIAYDEKGKAYDDTVSGKELRDALTLTKALGNQDKLDEKGKKELNMRLHGKEHDPKTREERKKAMDTENHASAIVLGRTGYLKRERAIDEAIKKQIERETQQAIGDSNKKVSQIESLQERIDSFAGTDTSAPMQKAQTEALAAAKQENAKKNNSSVDEALELEGSPSPSQQKDRTQSVANSNVPTDPKTGLPLKVLTGTQTKGGGGMGL